MTVAASVIAAAPYMATALFFGIGSGWVYAILRRSIEGMLS